MYISLYVEINIISFILLLIILIRTKGDSARKCEVDMFRIVTISSMFMPISDILWTLGEHGYIPFSAHANQLANMVYLVATLFSGYTWFVFTMMKLQRWEKFHKVKRILVAIPGIIASIICLLSIRTGWMFFVDQFGVYHRRTFHPVLVGTVYFYMTLSFLAACIQCILTKSRIKRTEAKVLASFIIFPAIGGLLQTVIFELPTSVIAVALALLLAFIGLQEAQISGDALTGLNNRRRADDYLENRLSNPPKNKRLIFFLLDIDSFKKINDTYGHPEGDRALQLAADALRLVCMDNNAFLARIGGDEFCIIWELPIDASPERLCEQIRAQMREMARWKSLPYPFQFSIGYSEYADLNTTVTAMMNQADKMLYEYKEKHHKTSAK